MDGTMTTKATIERRRARVANAFGVDPGNVRAIRLELSQMREAGLLIDVDIHGVSKFQARVTYNELGISRDDPRTERLRTGHKDLFPKHSKKLRSLEARARQNLDAHSHSVMAFGQWRWLPWTAYDDFMVKHQAIIAELEEVKRDVINRWDEIYEINRLYFAEIAERAWQAIKASHGGSETVIVTADGGHFDLYERNRFVEYVTQKALGKMPLPGEIEAQVRIDYRTSILYGEAELEEDAAAYEKAHAEAEAARLEAEHTQHKIWDLADQKAHKENERKARIAAIKHAEMEHAREQLARMGSPLQAALNGLRENVYDAVSELLAGLRKNDGFRGRSSTRAADLYEFWKRLNGGLLQDEELETSLSELEEKMRQYQSSGGADRKVQVGDIEVQLTEIAALTNAQARKLRKAKTSRAAALEL